MQHDPHTFGKSGEQLAAEYLAAKGYRIVKRNFRSRRNEIDIVALDGNVLCFVEVKARISLEKGHPAEAVTPQKQKEIIKAAKAYLLTLDDPEPDCRFDVVTIIGETTGSRPLIEHFPDAFQEELR